MPIFIAINKSDLSSILPDNFITNILEKYPDIKYKNVSAKSNEGIDELFLDIIENLYNDYTIPITNTNTILLNDDTDQKNWFNKCLIL